MNHDDSSRGGLLDQDSSALVIIDIQEKLLPVIHGREGILENAARLAKFAGIVKLPVAITEQEKLGPTRSEITSVLPEAPIFVKSTFDCFGQPEFKARMKKLGRKNLILCGIEAHICVTQTALAALAAQDGFRVHILSDAVGSRAPHNRETALARLSQAGAVISSTEMFIYEILGRAGTPEFKETLKLVK
ncbi:MAG: isochorismatase family protein [Pseudomonadota bacterium]